MEHNVKKNKKHRRRTPEQGDIGFDTIAKNSLIGIGTALLCMLVLSVALAALCMLSPDPASLTLPLGIAVFCLSAAVGGVVSARGLRADKTAAVVSGLICGFALMVLSGISAAVQNFLAPTATHGIPLLPALLLRAASIPLSAVFAFIVLKKKPRARRRRR